MNGVRTRMRPSRSILMNSVLPEGRATKIAPDNKKKKKLSLEYGKRPPVMQGFQSDCHFIILFKGILKNRKEINTFVDCSRSHLWGSSQMGLKMDSTKVLFFSQCYLVQKMALIHLNKGQHACSVWNNVIAYPSFLLSWTRPCFLFPATTRFGRRETGRVISVSESELKA